MTERGGGRAAGAGRWPWGRLLGPLGGGPAWGGGGGLVSRFGLRLPARPPQRPGRVPTGPGAAVSPAFLRPARPLRPRPESAAAGRRPQAALGVGMQPFTVLTFLCVGVFFPFLSFFFSFSFFERWRLIVSLLLSRESFYFYFFLFNGPIAAWSPHANRQTFGHRSLPDQCLGCRGGWVKVKCSQ